MEGPNLKNTCFIQKIKLTMLASLSVLLFIISLNDAKMFVNDKEVNKDHDKKNRNGVDGEDVTKEKGNRNGVKLKKRIKKNNFTSETKR